MTNIKEELLQRSNGGLEFFKIIFGSKYFSGNKNSYSGIKNTLYDDKNPSVSVHCTKSGIWKFKDFGEPSFSGDCFNLYALKYNVDVKANFNDLLVLMEAELNNWLINNKTSIRNYLKKQEVQNKKVDGKVNDIMFSEAALLFWKQFGITPEILNLNHVSQVNGYSETFEDGYQKSVELKRLSFAYRLNGYYKIYMPKSDQERKGFMYVGKVSGEYIFGQNFQADSNLIFITGGEKDAMTLHGLGYQAICLKNETIEPPMRLAKDLFSDGYRVVILYDNDKAGRQGTEKISKLYSWEIADLASILNDEVKDTVKDISDYIKIGLSVDKLKAFLNQFDEKTQICDDLLKNIETDNVDEIGEIADLMEQNEEQSYPPIPEEVYANLPPLLQQVTAPMKMKVQKDLVLAASLGVLSNIIEVNGVYRRKIVYPNLFIFITAPAASGKSIMSWAGTLGEVVQKKYNQQYNLAKQEFEDKNRKGEKPKRKTVFLSANASVSAFIRQLSKNDGKGTIFETEADSLNGVMKNEDWGSFSDVLRRAFEFEKVSMLRVNEEDSVEIENPRVSIVLSGTKNQLFKLMPSAENGLFSRFVFMDFPRVREWDIDDDLEDDESLDNYYKSLSHKIYEYHQRSIKTSIKFRLDVMQKQELKRYYSRIQNKYELLYGEDIIASIRRIANIHVRIAMLLSTIRMLDDEDTNTDLMCQDVDFETAKSLVNWFLKHTVKIFGQLPNKSKPYNELKTNIKRLYDSLREEFTYQEALSAGALLKIPNGTIQKHLVKLKKVGLLSAEAHGKYKKSKGIN